MATRVISARRFPGRGSATIIFVFLLFCRAFTGGHGTEVAISLDMPRFADRGSSASLHCAHNVPEEQLDKLAWRRKGQRLVDYVRDRTPQVAYVRHHGNERINVSLVVGNSTLIIHDLQFSDSDKYSCEVTLVAPIFSKESTQIYLQVIHPQRYSPKIKFGSNKYTPEDILDASCTTSVAHPTPHITWLINGEKVDVSYLKSYVKQSPTPRPPRYTPHPITTTPLPPSPPSGPSPSSPTSNASKDQISGVKSCTSANVHNNTIVLQSSGVREVMLKVDESHTIPRLPNHLGSRRSHDQQDRRSGSISSRDEETLTSSTTRLYVPVAALRLRAGGPLAVTCLATIPAYGGPTGKYGDVKNRTVMVEIVVTPEPELTTSLQPAAEGSSSSSAPCTSRKQTSSRVEDHILLITTILVIQAIHSILNPQSIIQLHS